MPEMTWTMMAPPRMSRWERNSFCQRCSTRVGFSPSSSSKSDSASTAATFGSQPVTSPQPTTFLSVSILRKVLGPHGNAAEAGDLDVGAAVLDAGGAGGGDGAGQGRPPAAARPIAPSISRRSGSWGEDGWFGKGESSWGGAACRGDAPAQSAGGHYMERRNGTTNRNPGRLRH